MNNETLQRLKTLALAATPGPWERETIRSDGEYGSDDDGGFGFDTYQVTDNKGLCIMDCMNNDVGAVEVGREGDAWDKVAKCDAAYVSAASPDVVLALIERIEALTVDAAPEHGKFGSPDLQAMIVKHATTPPVLAALANSAVLPFIERFDIYEDHGRANMMGDDDGEYVMHSDHEKAMRAYGQACAAAERASERECIIQLCEEEAARWQYPSHGNAAVTMLKSLIRART